MDLVPHYKAFGDKPPPWSMRKFTFRHTIIPVQMTLCFSLIIQGNGESQGIFPAEENNSKFLTKNKGMNFPLMNLPLDASGCILQSLTQKLSRC